MIALSDVTFSLDHILCSICYLWWRHRHRLHPSWRPWSSMIAKPATTRPIMRLQLDCSPSRCTRKINSRTNQKELRQIRDHKRKAFGEENSDLPGTGTVYSFVTSIFYLFFKITFEIMSELHKMYPEESDLPCQTCTLVQRSQVLLRCLGSFGNYFFSCCRK